MHINKSHRKIILDNLYVTLITRPRQEWEEAAKKLLGEIYARWYKKNIKPYEDSPLFQFLNKVPDVVIKDISSEEKNIRFELPDKLLLVDGTDTINLVPRAENVKQLIHSSIINTSYWITASIEIDLTASERQRYRDLKTQIKTEFSSIKEKITLVQHVLYSVRTFNQLNKAAPEIYKLVPSDIQLAIAESQRKLRERAANRKAGKKDIELDIDSETLQGITSAVCMEKLLGPK